MNELPSFEILYGDYWFEVTPEDYLIQHPDDNSICFLCIAGMDLDHWILGDAFMRGWYNIHDHENLRMGFVPHVGSSKSAPVQKTNDPATPLPVEETWTSGNGEVFGLTTEQFLTAASIAIVLSAVVILAVLFCYRMFLSQVSKGSSSQKKQVSSDGITLVYLE